jgi:hypothetical protein
VLCLIVPIEFERILLILHALFFPNKLLSFLVVLVCYTCAFFLTCKHKHNFMLLYLIVPYSCTVSEAGIDGRT